MVMHLNLKFIKSLNISLGDSSEVSNNESFLILGESSLVLSQLFPETRLNEGSLSDPNRSFDA